MKRLLYIGTPAYGFNKHIISELESLGYIIDYFNDRPSENSFVKGLIKLKPSVLKNYIQKYFQTIIKTCDENKYDVVLIINGKVFSNEMIKKMRQSQPNAKFIYYTWDSVENYPNSVEIAKEFDNAFTFDMKDSKDYKFFDLLPLFYSDKFKKVARHKENYQYDLLSVCTAHPNRYKIIKQFFPLLENRGVKIFSFLYINKLQYLYNKLKVPEFKNAKKNEFSFSILSEDAYTEKLKKSKALFDVEHSQQTGLTIRTIEALGAKRKLITTNNTIRMYDFYNENNIYVLDSENIDNMIAFLNKPFVDINENIYQKYSIKNWVESLLI